MRRLHDIPQEKPILKEYHFTFTTDNMQEALARLNRVYQNITTQVNILTTTFTQLQATAFR